MTVIAYSSRHLVMAADSRVSDDDGYHVTTCRKIFRLRSGALFGAAGEADGRELFALLERATPRRMPTRQQIAALESDVQALIVFPRGRVFRIWSEFVERGERGPAHWTGEVLEIEDPIVAIGSGLAYAYGAMEHGATPQEAVEIACRRDQRCAPPVQCEPLPRPRGRKP